MYSIRQFRLDSLQANIVHNLYEPQIISDFSVSIPNV
jgi:hypothetical protein